MKGLPTISMKKRKPNLCGIIGVMTGSLARSEIELWEHLLVVSNLRGSEGAGAIGVSKNGKLWKAKTTNNGVSLMRTKTYRGMMGLTGQDAVNCLIGHTRQPTRGGVELDSVHPHDVDKVIGVHNGTMSQIDGRYLKLAESDSSELYKSISANGVKKAIEDATGAYALVWIDKDDKTIHFLRNRERPLWFAKVGFGCANGSDPNTLYWASERIFLEFALRRKGVPENNYKLEELPPDEHRVYALGEKGWVIKPVSQETVKKPVTFREPANDYSSMYGHRAVTVHEPIQKGPQQRIWTLLPDGIDMTDNHGKLLQTIYLGDKNRDKDTWWIAQYEDGSCCEVNFYPSKEFVATVTKSSNQSNAIALPAPTRRGVNTVDSPFGQDSENSETTENESDMDCNLDEHNKRQAALDAAFSQTDEIVWEDSDDLENDVDIFEAAMTRVNTPRLSKKESRRQRAEQRRLANIRKLKEARTKAEEAAVMTHEKDFSSIGYKETAPGHWVSGDFYEKTLRSGCHACGNVEIWEDEEITWTDRTKFICEMCAEDPMVRSIYRLHPLDENEVKVTLQ